ncbi:PAS domain-containing sensor histidine kinase [Paraglaciecola aquimarina]|uniref:histidine kinase n=1 Tax=Paraglaciecola algarum TaxID=3050085 RepID=A0ABS9D6C7_9ALTE|nr:PAS domain-containing sensor histidine kinase [Paraglaciecola sp. G1-23]MCF2948244.1 PAS domain-containing sensor histidine kinase [Paraglaciecola sp. G1-23]
MSASPKSSNAHSSRLEAVLNTVIDGIITINNRGLIQSFNPSAVRIFGYSPEEVIGQNVKMLMPEPYHSGHDGYLSNYFSTGDKQIIGKGREVEAQRKDGSVFAMELGVNEMDIDGETMFVGTIRDISDRISAEQALKENQAKLQAIVDNTVDGLITIDQGGRIETFNKACETIFGYRANEVIEQNVKILMPNPYHREHDSYLSNYHNTGEKRIIGTGRQVEGRRKNGDIFPLDLSVSEVHVHGRKLYSGIVRDITDRKNAEEEIRQANAELEEFSYRTSHDLRSPLVSSIRLLDIVEESIRVDDKEKALMSSALIQKSLRQLESLVKDILTLTQAKNESEELEEINIESLIVDTLTKLKHMDNFERLNIDLSMKFDSTLWSKKNRMMLIIENLLSNAVKYQDLNKENSFINISTYLDCNNFTLKISDNGLGIPKNQQAQLFQMFKRFHPKTAFGSGLGLYMMKKSVDVLGGEIYFKDNDNGCTFIFTLPVR